MAWIHDTGYAPAYDHTGYPVAVQLDGLRDRQPLRTRQ